ncbi:MAG: DNA mismatch repair protein MutS [Opitutales bacterium]|nr:DNA mismatch repair protein MutS [Opitutales bacterium]MCH8541732.1 DNA mismatch repair protein MutS [Opitutales bacterium]
MCAAKKTPMMEQYEEAKKNLPPNTLLLFRLGDFYEMFLEDAEEGARILEITLTRRNDIPMAGIPYHAAEAYISKILAAGMKVAICEQMETPKPGKLVKRSLSRIITPGTILEADQLKSSENNYLLALSRHRGEWLAAWLDVTTGDFQITREKKLPDLLPLLSSLNPKEVVVPEKEPERWRKEANPHTPLEQLFHFLQTKPVSTLPSYHFETDAGNRALSKALRVNSLDGFGIAPDHPALGAAGAILAYASENLRAEPENLRTLKEYHSRETLLLDPATIRNLEIFASAQNTRDGSLLKALDRTVTAPGGRLLQNYLRAPLLDTGELRRRHQAVGELQQNPEATALVRKDLQRVRDLPRVLGRLENGLRNPRELGAIRETLTQIPALQETLASLGTPVLGELRHALHPCPDLRKLLEEALAEELPTQKNEGGFVRQGFDAELDRLQDLTRNNKTWLTTLETEEQARTGIKNLKVRFNNAFGYFIEVTKSNLHLVPDDYIRKQTMVNRERFVTEGLKEKEKEILHAEERANSREEEIFADLVEAVLKEEKALRETAGALAELDLFAGWADLARDWQYTCPELTDDDGLEITEGRHPVVEQTIREHPEGLAGNASFVPNDTLLESSGEQICLLTGPNMAGKSTYIRQVALIVLMAQIGCWVPAKTCRLAPVDRIFSRVGASDELARGNSTFMVEMNETANILNNATARSLVILDEIGRGTSTYDGLSIAWAVIEHLHEDPREGPRTLFATHYHELTQLAQNLHRLRNYSIQVKEWNEEIIFVRKVIPGPADRSYGIQVARLAGLPPKVISRASEILEKLESEDPEIILSAPAPKTRPKRKIHIKEDDDKQLKLFS